MLQVILDKKLLTTLLPAKLRDCASANTLHQPHVIYPNTNASSISAYNAHYPCVHDSTFEGLVKTCDIHLCQAASAVNPMLTRLGVADWQGCRTQCGGVHTL